MIETKRNGRRAVIAAVVALALVFTAALASGGESTSVQGEARAAGSGVSAQVDLPPADEAPDADLDLPLEPSTEQPDPVEAPAPGLSFDEQVYVDTLDLGGISYSSTQAALDGGYAICDFLAAGGSLLEATDIAMESGGYSPYDAGYIVGAAETALCSGGAW